MNLGKLGFVIWVLQIGVEPNVFYFIYQLVLNSKLYYEYISNINFY